MSVTVNVVGQTAVSVSVAASTSVSVVASGGIGPAGFITVPGTSTQAFGTFQLQAGDGITVSTADGQFLISSYPSTTVSSLAPVQSVAGRTGTIVLQASDVTAGTFAIGRIPTIGYTALSGVPVEFVPASHTHDAAAISSGVLSIARVPTISYTALSNTPATFTPSAHTHSTTDVVAFTAAASAAAPVQSVQSRTGAIVLTRADITAAAEVHSHSTADIVGLTDAFSQIGHTHDAAAVASGVLDIGRVPTIGYTALSGVPATFAPSTHTHSTTDVIGLTASFSQVGHTHDASEVTAGVLDIARVPVIGYTALSGVPDSFGPGFHTHHTTDIVAFTAAASAAAPVQSVAGRTGAISLAAADVAGLAGVATSGSYTSLSDVPATFAPITHTHSTSDISGYQGLPAQAGYFGPLVTDGTNATWTSRYSIVSPVLVQGAGMSFTRDTAAGEITIAFAGGTSGLAVGSLAPLALGVAAAGSSANASREDHVHKLPTIVDITAAAASHTHDAAAVTSGVLDIGRIPTIGYTALSGVPVSFTPSTHTHDAAAIASGTIDAARLPAGVSALNALTGGITIAGGANVTVSTASSTITIAAGGGGGSSAVRTFAVTNSGSGAYLIDGASNPTLTLERGQTYDLVINAAGHPFHLQTVAPPYSSGNLYTTGVTGSGTASGTIRFVVPYDAPSTLYYVCQYHSSMGGTINVVNANEDLFLRSFFTPAAPTGVTATAGNAQAVVSWTAPTVLAQTPITDYIVQFSSDSGSNWTTFSDGTSTAATATVTGLTNGTAYQFRVAGVNGIGTGAYSTASAAVTPVAGTPPNAPTSLTATASNAQIALTWTAPSAPGTYAITGYTVEYTPSGGSAQTVATGSTNTSYTLTGLTNGTSHSVRVRAVSAAGNGDYSTAVTRTPSAQTVPSAVRSLVSNAGVCGANSSWSAPASDGGSAITAYRVVIAGGVSNAGTTTQAASIRTKYIDSSSENAFTITVYAVNAIGESVGVTVGAHTGYCS